MSNVEALKAEFTGSDWKFLLRISDELVSIGGDDVITFFINNLSSEITEIRNASALALRDLSDRRATKPLIDSVVSPIDDKRCATFAYALETHDCSQHFIDIFRILIYSNYECKLNAHNILSEQTFLFTDDDLLEVKRMWHECLLDPTLCPAFNDMKDGIQDDIDSFLYYLNN